MRKKKKQRPEPAPVIVLPPEQMTVEQLRNRPVSERDKVFMVTHDDEVEGMLKKIGRPTKYRPEYAAKMLKWFMEKRMKVSAAGNVYRVLPTINKFSLTIGVPRETLWVWANKKLPDGELAHPAFHNAMILAKQIEEDVLAENTYNGSYQSTFAQLMAKNMLGWRDRTDVDVKSGDKELKRQTLSDMNDDEINDYLGKMLLST